MLGPFMETHIDLSRLHAHFFLSKRVPDLHTSTATHQKIVNYSQFSVNETTLSHKVKRIPGYKEFFSPLEDHEALNVSQLNDAHVMERLPLNEGQRYYLFTYSDQGARDLIQVLYSAPTIQILLRNALSALQHLLFGLRLLNQRDVCFFDLTPHNIVYLPLREKPVLRNFKFSVNLAHLDYTHLSHILHKLPSFTYQPFEIHVLYYFVKHKMVTISHGFIEDFCEEYLASQHVLRFFSPSFSNRCREQCEEMLGRYINKSRQEIVEDILERNDKWDVYGVSVLFVHIFACVARTFSLKDGVISQLVGELAKNLHPDSDKRRTLGETLYVVQCLLHEADWSFVAKLDNSLLPSLFEELAT